MIGMPRASIAPMPSSQPCRRCAVFEEQYRQALRELREQQAHMVQLQLGDPTFPMERERAGYLEAVVVELERNLKNHQEVCLAKDRTDDAAIA